jgi:urease accessory protein
VGWVSASLKLLPIGQQEGQNLIHHLIPLLIEIQQEIEPLDLDAMTSWTPIHEIRAMRHSQLEVKLFRS